MPVGMSENMSNKMPDGTSEKMPIRMEETRMPNTVHRLLDGISKICHIECEMDCQKICQIEC